MSDNSLDIKIVMEGVKKGVDADAELAKLREQIKGAKDDTSAYTAWLEKNAAALGEVSQAQKSAADELTRLDAEAGSFKKTIQDGADPALVHYSKTLDEVRGNTDKAFASKKQLKDMVKQLGHEFPILGTLGKLALNPIIAATAAVTVAVVTLVSKTREAVRDMGGFELPDFKEDAVARYERVAAASAKIKTDVTAIATIFSTFEKNQKILDAFAAGFGNTPDSSGKLGQAAREAGDRESYEAQRLRAKAGNYNPAYDRSVDDKKLLAAMEAEVDRLNARITIAKDAGAKEANWSWLGIPAGFKYLNEFGISNPDRKAAELEAQRDEIQQRMAGITRGGASRAARGKAFSEMTEAEKQAADFYATAAGYGVMGASNSGKDLKAASDALSKGDIASFVPNILALAKAITDGNRITEQALADQQKANEALLRTVNNNNTRP